MPVRFFRQRVQKVARGRESLSESARSCRTASAASLFQNFSLPLIRWFNCLTVDSIRLLVIGSPSLRYSG